MEYAEWLEMEREILARDRAAFTGERPLAGWEIDGRKQYAAIEEQQTGSNQLVHVQSAVCDHVEWMDGVQCEKHWGYRECP